MSKTAQTRAWIEVNPDALRANYELVRERAGARVAVIPMVKADGYGLGAEWVARTLDPLGPWGYGVAAVQEGITLRQAGVTRPIVVFSPQPPEAFEAAARHRLSLSISDLRTLERWAALAAQVGGLDFHLEIDTGMGRAGFDWRETGSWSSRVRDLATGSLRWVGVYTHFHGADAPDPTPTATQWERFRDALAQLPVSREDLMVHASNSAAALRWPNFSADAIRPGIFLYGGNPAIGVLDAAQAPRAVATVRARVALVRDVPPGSTVGYGATHIARTRETWATVAIGYGDGLRRVLGNRGEALIKGRRVRMVGRISMDMIVVDVSAIPAVSPGDIVTLIGEDGEEVITVDEVAAKADTISYEILADFTRRLPRVESAGD